MNFKKYISNPHDRIEATHLLVALILAANIVLFTQSAISILVQTLLIVAVALHNGDDGNIKLELKQLAAQLREDTNIFDRNVIVSETDLDGVITYANQRFCQISGYSKEELIGKSHSVLRDPDAPEEFFKKLWGVIEGGETFHSTFKNISKEGVPYWVDSAISPIKENSTVIGYKSIRFDITAQVLAREALRQNVNETTILLKEQGDRFEFAINSSRDGFWDYDVQNKKFYISAGWKKRLGFKEDESPTYLNYLELIPDEYRFEHHKAMDNMIDEYPADLEFVHFRIKYPILTKAGERILIEDVGDAFFDKDQELARITGFHRDVTEQARQAKMIESQNRVSAMGEMIGNIAHQWRQPIGAINNVLNDLEVDIELEDLTQIDASRFLQTSKKVKEYTAHLSQTIDDFRKISSDEKIKTNFFVKEVVEDAYGIVASEYDKLKIDFSMTGIGDRFCEFIGYKRELLQAIINILNNAKDVLVEKEIDNPAVVVDLSRDEERIFVTISDNAGGVPESIAEKIFDPYFTTKHESVGTGIGLYMSKKMIIEHFNGDLILENVNGGARFTISLPRPKKP